MYYKKKDYNEKIGILGAGQIGRNLGVLFCGLGLDVVLVTRNIEKTKKEILINVKIAKKLNKTLSLDVYSLLVTDDILNLKNCDFVIEAVSENLEIKKICLAAISNVVDENTVVSSTTSTKSITELANSIKQKQNFIGFHCFNPPTLINFIEVIKGEYTSEETFLKIKAFCDIIKENI